MCLTRENPKCPICGNVKAQKLETQPQEIDCPVCGYYSISENALRQLHKKRHSSDSSSEHMYQWQGAIRERHEAGGQLTIQDLEQLDSLVSTRDDPLESIDRILMYVYRKSESADEYLEIDESTTYPVAYANGAGEFNYFLEKAEDLGYLEGPGEYNAYRLGLKGWERVVELRSKGHKSDQAFVAMWFDSGMENAFENGIKPALAATDYKPMRIDMAEHNDKIDDRIIAEIRKSGLLIADFTGGRGGVYFEAGFALGLGVPVIWMCREDSFGDFHFDTRQYNHINWEGPADLEEKLRLRIEATVPRQYIIGSK